MEWSPALQKAYGRAIRLYEVPRIHILSTRLGGPYTGNGFRTIWCRAMDRAVERYGIDRFQFQDIRAKAATDGDDWRLLVHATRKMHDKVYNRKARPVKPVR